MRAFFAISIILVGLTVGLIIVSRGSDGGRDPTAAAPTPTPLVPLSPTPIGPALPATQVPPPLQPDPNRLGPETTLVEVATGRTVRLGDQNAVLIRFSFFSDGRWLIYDKSPPPPRVFTAAIYRVDLTSPSLQAERLTEGFFPHPSPDGRFIAFTRHMEGEQQSRVYVLDSQGNERALDMPGTPWSLSWSPDSRWLSYGEGYKGEDQRMATLVVDTQSWQEHIVGYRLPCNCDAPNAARWSASSRYFVYPYDEAGGSRLVSVSDWRTSLISSFGWWAPVAEILYYSELEGREPPRYNLVRYDAETGSTNAILRNEGFNVSSQAMSPDGKRFVATIRAGEATMKVFGMDGGVQIDGISGEFSSWSPDGRYILAVSRPSCRGTAVLNAMDGKEVRCFLGGSFGNMEVEFSPTSPIAAHVVSTAIGPVRGPSTPMTSDVFLVDLVTGHERKLLSDVRGPMHCVEWSPDGKWLILDDWCDGI